MAVQPPKTLRFGAFMDKISFFDTTSAATRANGDISAKCGRNSRKSRQIRPISCPLGQKPSGRGSRQSCIGLGC